MLREISVRNLAVIESARLEFSGRLVAITGETGTGKSLVVDAIGLALGDRADSKRVAPSAQKAVVSAVFDLDTTSGWVDELCELGLEPENGTLIVVREIGADGRSVCRLSNRPVPASVAKAVGERLVDLHGQHEHQTLLRPATHRDLLDAWIGDEAKSLRELLAKRVQELRELEARIADLEGRSRERERLADLLRFELAEIETAAPTVGEDEVLLAERKRIQNAERLGTEVAKALGALTRSEGSACDALSIAETCIERAAEMDGLLREVLEQLRTALVTCREAAGFLSSYADSFSFDPERIAIVEDRLDLLNRLKRKYGASIEEVLAYKEKARASLAELEVGEEAHIALRARETELREEVCAASQKLTRLRKSAKPRFEKEALGHIRELAMEQAAFEVRLTPKEVDAGGAEWVEFLFSANPDHSPQPLGKIASGGELSRVMLALHCALAGASPVPTIVYDEVDAGLGGQVAGVVAEKLRKLSEYSQVIVITHLAQIAGRADEQFCIAKSFVDGKTQVEVRRLDGEERVEELARMLSGDEARDAAIRHARELLVRG